MFVFHSLQLAHDLQLHHGETGEVVEACDSLIAESNNVEGHANTSDDKDEYSENADETDSSRTTLEQQSIEYDSS